MPYYVNSLYKREEKIYFSVFVFISTVVCVLQNYAPYNSFYDGLFIPDVISMSQSLDAFQDTQYSLYLLIASIPGIAALYTPAWLIHPAMSFGINLVLMYFSTRLIGSIFVRTHTSRKVAYIALLCNPYIFLAMSGPNKEIPLLFLTLLFVRNVIFHERWWFVSCSLVAVCIFLFRDGYGALLLIMVLILWLFNRSFRPFLIVSLVALPVMMIVSNVVTSFIPFLARNRMAIETINAAADSGLIKLGSSASGANPVLEIVMLFLRTIYNLLTMAFFPQFLTTDGAFYVLGIGYWVYGVSILSAVISCILLLIKRWHSNYTNIDSKISCIVLYCTIALSISIFIQPRYLMPILPLAVGVMASASAAKILKTLVIVFLMSCCVMTFYYFRGNPPVAIDIDMHFRPSFLLETR